MPESLRGGKGWGWGKITAVAALCIAISVVLYELGMALKRHEDRKSMFARAQERARATGKPLMVIGDPFNGTWSRWVGQSYGCGDVCVDLTGCPDCSKETTRVAGDISEVILSVPDNSFVVFVSCVLEYVDADLDDLHLELQRVSGGDLFIVTVSPYTLTSILYHWIGESVPRHRIYGAPPDHEFVHARIE